MRPKAPCTSSWTLLLGTALCTGAHGLRTKRGWQPVWSIPYEHQDREDANATAATEKHLHLTAGRLDDRLTQWQYVASLFVGRESGRLQYFDDFSNGTKVNTSINSAGSIEGLDVETVSSTVALLACLAVGLPLALCFLLQGLESWQDGDKAEPRGHQGGSVGIVMTGSSRQPSRIPAGGETKHRRLISAFQTHDYAEPEEATRMMLLDAFQSVLIGVSTALVTFLDAMSFSFFTGVSLLNSVWAGCIVCVVTALVGGRPGMISSTSAATAVVLARVSRNPELGLGPMALCVFIAGILQVLAAGLRLSRFVTLIPQSVVIGCITGLAIITFCAQLRHYHYNGDGQWVAGTFWSVTVTALFAVAAGAVWSRVPVLGRALPAPLVAVLLAWGFSALCQPWLAQRTLGDIAGGETLQGGLGSVPAWDFPPQGVDWGNLSMWATVVPVAVRFALAGLFESLMTQSLIDEITQTSGSMRRECFGQGVANVVASLFGTQGGGAVAVQSFLNIGSGGGGRLAGFVTGALLGLSVLAVGPQVAWLPAAAPLGLVAVASLNTIAWGVVELLSRHRAFDCVVAVIVTVLTIWDDVAAAVIAGVIISMLGFAWKVAIALKVESVAVANQRTFHLRGPLFFGSALSYRSEIDPARIKEDIVILDFTNSRILDVAGIDAIEKTRDQLRCAGKSVMVQGVPPDAELHLGGPVGPAGGS